MPEPSGSRNRGTWPRHRGPSGKVRRRDPSRTRRRSNLSEWLPVLGGVLNVISAFINRFHR